MRFRLSGTEERMLTVTRYTNFDNFQKPVVRPGLPRSLHIDSIEPIDR